MYKIIFDTVNNKQSGVLRLLDEAFIPVDESNTDYQEYLKWIAEGNLPSPADIVEPSPTASVEPQPADGE